jgi:uncharacterized protein
MDISQGLAQELNVTLVQVNNTLALLEANNTVPFIARYRKEQTQGLDEEQIFKIQKMYEYRVNLAERKEDVIRLIDEQGLLSEDLKKQINSCERLSEVEEIYLPFKQKKLTKASIAIAKGLEPLSQWMLLHDESKTLEEVATKFLSDEVLSVEEAIEGACDILSENLAQAPAFKRQLKTFITKYGKLETSKKKKAEDLKQVYQMYYEFSAPFNRLQHHNILAINRAEKQKVITVSIAFDLNDFLLHQQNHAFNHPNKKIAALIKNSFDQGVKKMAYPSVIRSIRSELSEAASDHSIDLFASNIESLLSIPPIKETVVLGLDPAFRTGCKLAVVSENGDVLAIDTIYPFEPQHQKDKAKQTLSELIKKHNVNIIAIGNGTASRESEQMVVEVLVNHPKVSYAVISEAGASVYSASPLAKKEFPNLDVSLRSAISIARRLQDPLAELIKIDPQSIGVGQYQHDLPKKSLTEKVGFVVDKVVNRVGVNINTASAALLEHVSGLNKTAIKNMLAFRKKEGEFKNRKQLLTVKGLGDKMFEQAGGFLRIMDGDHWLDQTAIHPESYPVVEALLKHSGIDDITNEDAKAKLESLKVSQVAATLSVDEYTLSDIINDLLSPNRDYRQQFDGLMLRQDILSMDDLKVGLRLMGSVSNIVDFGIFVDIGLKNDGFAHRSKLNIQRHVNPIDVFAIQQKVNVEIIEVDTARQRVSLKVIKN